MTQECQGNSTGASHQSQYNPSNVTTLSLMTNLFKQPDIQLINQHHQIMPYLIRPHRYDLPSAATRHKPSTNHKVSKMLPSKQPSRAALRTILSRATSRPASIHIHCNTADPLANTYYTDTYRPSYTGRSPEQHYRADGEQTAQGGHLKGRESSGQPVRGSWSAQFERGWRGRHEYGAVGQYHDAEAVQSSVPQQDPCYQRGLSTTPSRQQYWDEASSYHQIPPSAPTWQRFQGHYSHGKGQYYYYSDRYGQWASHQTATADPYYGQAEMYVPPYGYSYEQSPYSGSHQQQYLTQGWQAANQLNADATTFQPSHNWRTEPEGLGDDDGGVRLPVEQPAKQNKHLQILKRPIPSPAYLKQATQSLQTLDTPKQLLVVLDLNGTLLYRKQRGGASFVARPMVNDFIQYLLAYHKVMVWSSARPENVTRMCEKLFDKEQRQELAAVWARDTLRIPSPAYNSKVQVYKQLSWVWKDKSIQASHPDAKGVWDQSNTVLIDDSVDKAASEPHNSICLEEFQNLPEQRNSDVLGQVVKYLEMLKREKDVSAFMQLTPFTYAPGETFDWRI